MTYVTSEQSIHSGKPNELFRFVGTYGAFYYTSGPVPVEFKAADEDEDAEPNIYQPIAMSRSEITIGTMDDDGTDLTVEMSVKNELVVLYGFKVSPPELKLTIFRYHPQDEDYAQYWHGDINNITAARGKASLRSASILSQSSSAEFPNVFYQRPCNHILFDDRCQQVEDDWKASGTVEAIAGRIITVSDLGGFSGQLVGGEIALASGERRMIVAEDGSALTVNFPFARCEVDDNYSVVVGCDHDWSGDCANRFHNQKQFGGFRHIPSENPFAAGIDPAKDPIGDNTCLAPTPGLFPGWWLKFKVDFWAGSCGPVSFPNTYLAVDYAGISDYGYTIDAAHQGSGGDGDAVQLQFSAGEHLIQSLEYTIWNAGAHNPFETDPTLIIRNYDLRLQFPAFDVCGTNHPAGAYATASIRHWYDNFYTDIPCISGNTLPLVDGKSFDIEGLWPRNYLFTF